MNGASRRGHETFNEQNHPNGLVFQILVARPEDDKSEPGQEHPGDLTDDGHGMVECENTGDGELEVAKTRT